MLRDREEYAVGEYAKTGLHIPSAIWVETSIPQLDAKHVPSSKVGPSWMERRFRQDLFPTEISVLLFSFMFDLE